MWWHLWLECKLVHYLTWWLGCQIDPLCGDTYDLVVKLVHYLPTLMIGVSNWSIMWRHLWFECKIGPLYDFYVMTLMIGVSNWSIIWRLCDNTCDWGVKLVHYLTFMWWHSWLGCQIGPLFDVYVMTLMIGVSNWSIIWRLCDDTYDWGVKLVRYLTTLMRVKLVHYVTTPLFLFLAV